MKTDYSPQKVSLKAYNNLFDEKSIAGGSKWEKAYERAAQTREFEIGLYWKRATYFWAFITTIYVAYYHALMNIYHGNFGHFPTFILSGVGFFFAVAWILVAKGSKHWQENWENHIRLLEDEVTGPLYKLHEGNSFSVSKVNLCAGYVVATCAGGLFVFETAMFCHHMQAMFSIDSFALFLAIIATAILGICSLVFFSKGNETGETKEILFNKLNVREDDE